MKRIESYLKVYPFFIFVVSLILYSTNAFGATIYVPSEYSTIQAGIDAASEDDTVLVADGTYTGEGNKDLDFGGKAITVQSESGPEKCVIDCEGDGRGFYFHSGEGENSKISGFSIINGNVSDYGGGIYCYSISAATTAESPTISDCIISNNTAGNYGGGIYCLNSSPTITGCIIRDNTADSGGGIKTMFSSAPTIIDCTIENNESTHNGAGIDCSSFSSSLDTVITNCTIEANTAGESGGGIHCMGSSMVITNCAISGNSTASEDGGGIDCILGATLVVSSCIIDGNIAGIDGGGISCHESSATVTNSIVYGNATLTATGNGGGVSFIGDDDDICTATITNCIISGNTAVSDGGGIFYWGQASHNEMNIINCTISNNSTDDDGGGVYHVFYPVDIKNSILWTNSPDEIDSYRSDMAGVTYSDVQGGYSGEGNINADPLFMDAENEDYHLTAASPCIDTGTNEGAPDTDIEGNERPKGGGYDMGAFESEYTNQPPTISSTNPVNNATGVAIDTAIAATFSEAMDSSTITTGTFSVSASSNITGTVTYSGTTATFTPAAALDYTTTYTATITTDAKDLAGNALEAEYTWSFTTGTEQDTTLPTVFSTTPADSATMVAIDTAIAATFSEAMDSSTITTGTFSVSASSNITGTVTYSGTTATFTPAAALDYTTTYTATITTDAKDLAGNALEADYTWSFTTEPETPTDGEPPTDGEGDTGSGDGGGGGCFIATAAYGSAREP